MSNHKKYKKNAPATLQLLRELEISLRTNHVGWVKQFIRDYSGLDALVDFLKFACWGLVVSTINVKVRNIWTENTLDQWSTDPVRGTLIVHGAIKILYKDQEDRTTADKEMNEVIKQFDTMRRSNSLPSRRVVKNSRFLLDRDEVHLCILCFRAIMNYQYGLTECVRNFS